MPICGMLTQGVRGIGERHHARCRCQALRVSTPVARSRRNPGWRTWHIERLLIDSPEEKPRGSRSVATTPWLPSTAYPPTRLARSGALEIRPAKSGFLALPTALAHLDAEYTARAHLQPALAAQAKRPDPATEMLIKCHPGIRSARTSRGATLEAVHFQRLVATENGGRSLARTGIAIKQRFPTRPVGWLFHSPTIRRNRLVPTDACVPAPPPPRGIPCRRNESSLGFFFSNIRSARLTSAR